MKKIIGLILLTLGAVSAVYILPSFGLHESFISMPVDALLFTISILVMTAGVHHLLPTSTKDDG